MLTKKLFCLCLVVLCALSGLVSPLVAEDKPAEQPAAMPPMGPPAEMKQMEFLIGTWDAVMLFKMDPADTNWVESKGVSTYKWVLGGGALESEYSTEFMAMPFQGFGLDCYDRETKKWQSIWVDNMSARIAIYTGDHSDGKWVYSGEDMYGGKKMMTRLTNSNFTPTSFDWLLEQSFDGGKTFQTMGSAKYTKRQ